MAVLGSARRFLITLYLVAELGDAAQCMALHVMARIFLRVCSSGFEDGGKLDLQVLNPRHLEGIIPLCASN